MNQPKLFQEPRPVREWKPLETLPELSRYKEIALDTETTGKHKFKDKPIGKSICTPDRKAFYLPFGHLGGGNLDPALVKRWAKRELRDKDIYGLHIGFDSEIERNWGVDLEGQNCRLHEIGHRAALLNEHRYSGFSLDSLGKEYVGRGKSNLQGVAKDRMADTHSSEVGPYAEEDALLTWDIKEATDPLIAKESLGTVLDLEDDILYCVNSMERNAARINVPLLRQWKRELADRIERITLALWRDTKVKVNPDSIPSMHQFFAALNIPQQDSYDKEAMKKYKTHDKIKLAMDLKHYKSIKSKYIDKYYKALDGDILRFKLHQLRAGEGDYGTITGRFSSAAPDYGNGGFNCQQCMKVENQIENFGDEYIIRELFIPDDGFDFFSADASQIEFRFFAHYSNDVELIRLYNENPWIDFHQIVADMIHQTRNHAKHNNFGKLYGMGLRKLCRRLGLDCVCGCPDQRFWSTDDHEMNCPAIKGILISREYDAKFPAAKRLLQQAATLGKQRGWVKTILGRRGRFDEIRGTGYHAALNKVIQGTAADYNKLKLRDLYRERATLGVHKLRMSVHDEVDGDIMKGEKYQKLLAEFLNEQALSNIKVPILWKVDTGANWKECA